MSPWREVKRAEMTLTQKDAAMQRKYEKRLCVVVMLPG